jgi:hypothetical protein
MITRSSGIYHHITKSDELNISRAQVLIKLCQSGKSIDDIAEAINSNESLVRSVLVRPFRPFDPHDANNPIRTIDTVHGPSFPLSTGPAAPVPGHAPEVANARDHEEFARHLATEIRRWLGTFETTDAERLQAVVKAGYDLSDSMGFFSGKYLYETGWVAFEIIAIWKPLYLTPDERDFQKAAGRWLAAWIRFWIADPDIWNRALDLAFDYFEAAAQAA